MSSDADWKKWGTIDPLWAVATWRGKQAGGASPWTDEEFYATGQADWAQYLARWERHGLDRDSCVEIGCGAGRLTKHLAADFRRTWALDVSQDMLDYARQRIARPSIEFLQVTGAAIPLPADSASAVFSTFVFQHFDSLSVAARYFREIARVLRPGGSLLIHLPVHRWPWDRRVFDLLHLAWSALAGLGIWLRRALVPLGARPPMRGLSYAQPWIFETLQEAGLAEIEISSVPSPGSRGAHQLVYARKPVGAHGA